MKPLTSKPVNGALSRLLDPLGQCLTPAAARSMVRFRVDAATKTRIAELGDKCNEGQLTASERDEYETYARAINLISIIQSKARRFLKTQRTRK